MKYVIMLIMLVSVANGAIAETKFSQLSASQQAELIAVVASSLSKVDGDVKQVQSDDSAAKWIDFGKHIGAALSGTARELGVVANDFIKTPAGQLTTYLIVWKVMGRDIIHIAAGLIILLTMLPIWMYMFRRMCIIKGFTYVPISDNPRSFRKIAEFYDPKDVSEERAWLIFILIVVISVSTIILVT